MIRAVSLAITMLLAIAVLGSVRVEDVAAGDQTGARSARLEQLFVELRSAKDVEAAQAIEAQIWETWLRSGDDTIDAMVREAMIAMRFGQLDNALAVLDAVVTQAPDFAEGWNKRATVLYFLEQYDRSMADIAHVLKLEPRHFGAISGIGLIRAAQGDKRGAIEAFEKVLEIYPLSTGAKQNIQSLSEELEGDPT